MENNRYTIGDLAAATGVTERTIRYYTTEKLLPEPDSSRYPATYNVNHLRRLQLILRFKEAFVPLERIRQKVAALSDADVERELAQPTPASSSAADYIAGLRAAQQPIAAPALSPKPSPAPMLYSEQPSGGTETLRRAKKAAVPEPDATWQRFVLSPDLELHARLPITPETQTLLDTLLTHARLRLTTEAAPKDRKENHS